MKITTRIALTTVWAVAAFSGACGSRNPAPKPTDSISFSHHLHTEQGLDCTDCHSPVNKDAEQKIVPMAMAQCGDCHDIEDAEGCKICHSNPDDPGTWAAKKETHILFSHQQHQRRSVDCKTCHSAAAHIPTLEVMRDKWPGHLECNVCHQRDYDEGKCARCHDRLWVYAQKPETMYRHEIDFLAKHGTRAASNEAVCAGCHDQNFCTDCHYQNATVRPSVRFPDRVDRHFMHQGDWISRHAVESKLQDLTCQKCHGVSYCAACHERNGIGQTMSETSPHGDSAIWMSPGPGSHSAAARKNIAECASCHDRGAASNCVACHRSGGVNPHPVGFKSAISPSERTSHPMCSICHGI